MVRTDLAAGYSTVLLLAPLNLDLETQVAKLTQNGSRLKMLVPDQNALTAFGVNPLDPDTRTPAAHAGRTQGQQAAAAIAECWS